MGAAKRTIEKKLRYQVLKCELRRVFLETITACASAKSHFVDISLVYWKALAHLQPKFIVNTAKLFSRQHRTNINERATSSALMAHPFS